MLELTPSSLNNVALVKSEVESLERIGTNKTQIGRVESYYVAKTDQNILAQIDTAHIYDGHINNNNNAVGFHREASGINEKGQINAKVTAYTFPPNDVGVYTGRIEVNGIAKTSNQGQSTFVPKDWSVARTNYEITEAFKAGQALQPTNNTAFNAVSPSGVQFRFVPPTSGGSVSKWRGWPIR
ncbi:EndoU domain-containing protein [Undibacterium sp. TC4M20W]|uniref:EndoU domain-containing protein n=1 Tax=Undibacterium sp. TC4M20W TaxID=3413052 RepID=UPI003BF1D0A6